jgi:hypothetical protein
MSESNVVRRAVLAFVSVIPRDEATKKGHDKNTVQQVRLVASLKISELEDGIPSPCVTLHDHWEQRITLHQADWTSGVLPLIFYP